MSPLELILSEIPDFEKCRRVRRDGTPPPASAAAARKGVWGKGIAAAAFSFQKSPPSADSQSPQKFLFKGAGHEKFFKKAESRTKLRFGAGVYIFADFVISEPFPTLCPAWRVGNIYLNLDIVLEF